MSAKRAETDALRTPTSIAISYTAELDCDLLKLPDLNPHTNTTDLRRVHGTFSSSSQDPSQNAPETRESDESFLSNSQVRDVSDESTISQDNGGANGNCQAADCS